MLRKHNFSLTVQGVSHQRLPVEPRVLRLILVFCAVVLIAGFIASRPALARLGLKDTGQASPMHPTFPLLDQAGENVLDSGQPVSAMETCGACHDTDFIRSHTEHAGLGADPFPGPGQPAEGQVAGLEMNCFLCHTPDPNNAARELALESGQAAWATTATLLGSGIVEANGKEFRYLAEAFDEAGELHADILQIHDPASENCGQCHGTVHTELSEPFIFPEGDLENWRGGLTGQVVSPQKLSESGLNLAGKEGLDRSFDVHAERGLGCTDCHYSLNNPVYFQEGQDSRPEHLEFDPRRLELGEYLHQPVHDFAHGPEGEGQTPSMRRCESCHSLETTHNWLPYKERHTEKLSCETCHIPKMYSPAFEQVDWTVLNSDGTSRIQQRGIEADGLFSGYNPVMLSTIEAGGGEKLAPYNLVATWYWVSGEPGEPVGEADLKAAWFEGGEIHPDILAALDEDGSGSLEESELALDRETEVQAVAARLEALGRQNPRISGEVQPYSLHHGVTGENWAVKDCSACHSQDSRLESAFPIAGYIPGGVMPELVAGSGVDLQGVLYREADGKLYYRTSTRQSGLYVLGNDAARWIDLFGSLIFVGVLLGIAIHGTLRAASARRRPRQAGEAQKVYLYGVYERLWHWLQTFTILGLLLTGLVIHKPDTFSLFSFRGVVLVHNILAAILIVNAGLSLFYHLASGEIRQYLPRPAGLFDQLIQQGLYYLRGIFKGEVHPFEKSPDRKLNPLQQITYFGLLNVLLPLQIFTGAMMWGTQHWPELATRLGGLPFLAPFHSLISWLLVAFVVGHIYLTTTGNTPFASIQAMMFGWDELDGAVPVEEGTD
jgi:thiosulfate reductase cytochrome b subunit